MTLAARRIQEGLGVRGWAAIAIFVAGFVVLAMALAGAARWNLGLPLLGAAVAAVGVLASMRWPLLPLYAMVALIPIEEAVVFGEFGSLSRYMEILFIVVYAVPRLGRLTISAMPAAGWGFVIWATLSLAWAINPTGTLDTLPILWLLFAMALIVAAAVVERPAIVRRILWVYSLSAAVTAVIGIADYLQGTLVAPDRISAIQGQDPAHYAALLLPALVFSLFELMNGRMVPIAAAIAFVSTLGIIVSGTRGAWVAAAVVGGLYLFPRLGPGRRILAVMLLLGLGAASLQVPGVSSLIADRADDAISSGGAGRTDIWTVGLLIYESAPLTGVGYSDFPDAYTPERVRSSSVETIAPWRPAFRDPHNLVIGTAGELGIVGLIVLISFLAPLLVRPGWGPEANVVQASLASLVVVAMFLDLFLRKEIWLMIGLACGLAWLARHAKERGLEPAVTADPDGPMGMPKPRRSLGPLGRRGRRLVPGTAMSTAIALSSADGAPAEPAGPSRLAPRAG
jgi:O-antigen ligase